MAEPNLKTDIYNSEVFKQKIRDKDYAQNLYAALCNNDWQKEEMLPMLEDFAWSTSWRGSGHLVADLRNSVYNLTEDYMSYYCSGMECDYDSIAKPRPITSYVQEGIITTEIRNDLRSIGWTLKNHYV